MDNVELPS